MEGKAAMAVSVPYDVILEILQRVKDVVTLFRCATTCKGLCRLLAADPSLVRRCLTEDVCRRSAPFAGFFTERRLRRGIPAPCLIPPSRPVLEPRCRSLSFFLLDIRDPSFFNHAVPLASRHGLLLVRLDQYRDRNGHLLAVCNLLTGKLDVLPRLEHNSEFDDHDVTGYAILTSPDCSTNNDQQEQLNLFKVFVIGIWSGRTMQYRLCTFSSAGEARWNMSAGSVEGGHNYLRLWQHSAAVCHGMVHWLFWFSASFYSYDAFTFDVCVETNHCSFTRRSTKIQNLMYIPNYEPYISVDTEERLTLFFERKGPRLEIWTLQNNRRWSHTRMITLKQLNQHESEGVSYTCLGEKCGTLLVKDNYHRVYFADTMTGVMHGVKNWPNKCNLSRKRTVPLDMDWPAFVLSRLSVATCSGQR